MMNLEGNNQIIDLNSEPNSCVQCSICLDLVELDGERSMAKLQCGHQFHLDCIGSAFNVKRMMQCPNCRNTENGQWLYPNGSVNSVNDHTWENIGYRSYPVHDMADVMDVFRICPFQGLDNHPSWGSNLGDMNSLARMMMPQPPQHPGSSPHPYGWMQYQQAPYHQQSSSSTMPINGGSVRIDTPRSMTRSIPQGRVYTPMESTSYFGWGPM